MHRQPLAAAAYTAAGAAKLRTTFILFGVNKEWSNRSAKTEAAASQCATTRLSGRAPREDWRKRPSTWSRESWSNVAFRIYEETRANWRQRPASGVQRLRHHEFAPPGLHQLRVRVSFLVSSGMRTAPPTSAVCGCASLRSTGDTSAT